MPWFNRQFHCKWFICESFVTSLTKIERVTWVHHRLQAIRQKQKTSFSPKANRLLAIDVEIYSKILFVSVPTTIYKVQNVFITGHKCWKMGHNKFQQFTTFNECKCRNALNSVVTNYYPFGFVYCLVKLLLTFCVLQIDSNLDAMKTAAFIDKFYADAFIE